MRPDPFPAQPGSAMLRVTFELGKEARSCLSTSESTCTASALRWRSSTPKARCSPTATCPMGQSRSRDADIRRSGASRRPATAVVKWREGGSAHPRLPRCCVPAAAVSSGRWLRHPLPVGSNGPSAAGVSPGEGLFPRAGPGPPPGRAPRLCGGTRPRPARRRRDPGRGLAVPLWAPPPRSWRPAARGGMTGAAGRHHGPRQPGHASCADRAAKEAAMALSRPRLGPPAAPARAAACHHRAASWRNMMPGDAGGALAATPASRRPP